MTERKPCSCISLFEDHLVGDPGCGYNPDWTERQPEVPTAEPTAKVTLTASMVDDLMMAEVETFFGDHGREPEGTGESVGRRAFCEIVEAAYHGMARTSRSVTITLTGEALAYAANDRWGPFDTRADILKDWDDAGSHAMARAFAARQRQCAEALSLTEARPASDPVNPTAEQRVAETQTGDAPVSPEQVLTERGIDPTGPRGKYILTLVDQVEERQSDGGVKAQVAALAVRRITDTKGAEWLVLTRCFGIPTTRDWEMAQAAYGPTAGLPGLAR
jgi:hypothetical protein